MNILMNSKLGPGNRFKYLCETVLVICLFNEVFCLSTHLR
jgi:hypothetical protein